MKIAYYAESSADEAVLKIFTEAILGISTDPVLHNGLRHRGWPSVRTALPSVIKQLHYHTDAEGFVFIADSNGSPPHLPAHNAPNSEDPACRLCRLRQLVAEACQKVAPRPHQPPLKIALGLAIPAIEAWLLCDANPHLSEAAWTNGLRQGKPPYRRTDLKFKLYGTSRPSLSLETESMTEAALRHQADLSILEKLFPSGFGALKTDLKKWEIFPARQSPSQASP